MNGEVKSVLCLAIIENRIIEDSDDSVCGADEIYVVGCILNFSDADLIVTVREGTVLVSTGEFGSWSGLDSTLSSAEFI